jgi:arginyl-tRNA synthetase
VTNTFYFDDFGRQYRSRVIAIIRDKFGAEKDHKMKGNNLVFDLERLDKMKKIYENDGKIKTKPLDESSKNERENGLDDSLIHSEHTRGRGYASESSSNHSKRENEIKQMIHQIPFGNRL